jgi:hypothetical protein
MEDGARTVKDGYTYFGGKIHGKIENSPNVCKLD